MAMSMIATPSAQLGKNIAIPPRTNLTNRDGRAQRRHTILVKALDRDPICLPHRQRAQLERRPLIGEALMGLVQLRRGDTPAHVVADDPRHGTPGDDRIALILPVPRREPRWCLRSRTRPVAEDADVADGEVRGANARDGGEHPAAAL